MSSAMNNLESRMDNVIVLSYVDKNGSIQVAKDLGYAQVRKAIQKGHVVKEMYYGKNNQLVEVQQGYCGNKREYNETGQGYRTFFLDQNESVTKPSCLVHFGTTINETILAKFRS